MAVSKLLTSQTTPADGRHRPNLRALCPDHGRGQWAGDIKANVAAIGSPYVHLGRLDPDRHSDERSATVRDSRAKTVTRGAILSQSCR